MPTCPEQCLCTLHPAPVARHHEGGVALRRAVCRAKDKYDVSALRDLLIHGAEVVLDNGVVQLLSSTAGLQQQRQRQQWRRQQQQRLW